jgi:4-hydroxy-tetrahydrodipicolinate reductase
MRAGKPLVSGVTGLDDGQMRDVVEAARAIPLLYERNMSLGIAVLAELVALAAGNLGPAFAASVHEVHHLHKKDAPSGTALKLGEALAGARNQAFGDVCRYGPGEAATRRAAGDIVITAERRGDVAGEHHVRFESGAETLTLSHSVTDRGVFAAGALAAAEWLTGQPPGLYGMRDVVQARAAGGGQPSRDSVK